MKTRFSCGKFTLHVSLCQGLMKQNCQVGTLSPRKSYKVNSIPSMPLHMVRHLANRPPRKRNIIHFLLFDVIRCTAFFTAQFSRVIPMGSPRNTFLHVTVRSANAPPMTRSRSWTPSTSSNHSSEHSVPSGRKNCWMVLHVSSMLVVILGCLRSSKYLAFGFKQDPPGLCCCRFFDSTSGWLPASPTRQVELPAPTHRVFNLTSMTSSSSKTLSPVQPGCPTGCFFLARNRIKASWFAQRKSKTDKVHQASVSGMGMHVL